MEDLRQEVGLTEVISKEISGQLELMVREMECLKIDVLRNYLEEQKNSAARDKGITYLIKDRKRVRNSLLLAAGSFVLGGLLTRDTFGALAAGMSGFDGMVRGFGESKWCVLLGKKISVVPEETISLEATWITLASFHKTMKELKRRALAGDKLGNLDNVISKLTKKRRLSQQ